MERESVSGTGGTRDYCDLLCDMQLDAAADSEYLEVSPENTDGTLLFQVGLLWLAEVLGLGVRLGTCFN